MNSLNKKYLGSAIEKLYGREEDFIVIGLTGRTGSGCSTVAKILCEVNLKHSLYTGTDELTNEKRKRRIVGNWINNNWKPFSLIQVRSIITLLMAEDIEELKIYSNQTLNIDRPKADKVVATLSDIHATHLNFDSSTQNIADTNQNSKKVTLSAPNSQEFAQKAVNFYTEKLPFIAEQIRNELGEKDFVKLYQKVGRNIRLSGNPFNENLVNGKFFTLAQAVNSVIKIIRRCQRTLGRETFIVVDAIRNPLEAIFFQDRYAAFFLMAVSAPDKERKARLRTLNFSEKDIDELDKYEYEPRDLDEPEFFSVQDIQGCLQRADLYVSNPDAKNAADKFSSLSSQVLKFIALIRRPGIVTPSHVERCMQIAYTAKLNSGCISRQVGAVVTGPDFSIRSLGWNDVALGQVPCNLRSRSDLLSAQDLSAYSDYELGETFKEHLSASSNKFLDLTSCGRHTPFCFKSEYNILKKEKNQVHTRSLHAEENAFLQAARHHSATLEGGFLFTTAAPCELCSKKAYQLGIKAIYYIDPYPGIAVDQILHSGDRRPTLELFSGAIGKAFHRLYTPIVPLKDELNALIPASGV
jgi:deoxycytidylate deaminase/dephospho-CoA kinase